MLLPPRSTANSVGSGADLWDRGERDHLENSDKTSSLPPIWESETRVAPSHHG